MSKVFYRKKFSEYLGEQRALLDIYADFIPNPSPTPTSTPLPITPTPTPTPPPTPIPNMTGQIPITGICPGGLNITGSTWSINFNGVDYYGIPAASQSSLNVCFDLPFPVSGDVWNFQINYPVGFSACTGSFDEIVYNIENFNGIVLGDYRYNAKRFNYLNNVFVSSAQTFISYDPTPSTGNTGCILDILFAGSPVFNVSGATPVTPTPTPTPTTTPAPVCDITYTVLPTPTPSVTPTITPTPLVYYYDAQDCSDPFASPIVVKSNSLLLIGSAVKVIGDPNTCYEILNVGFAPENEIVDTTYVDCLTCLGTITPTPTPTPSITPTMTVTPTITPTITPSPSPAGFDPDAQIYINEVILSGGTLSGAEQTAIDNFFIGLKTDGIFNKLYYLHLFLGGTAGSNGLNAINPGTYDLNWQGTWSHYTSGSTTTQNNANYAESGFVVSLASPSTTQTDFSFGVMITDRNQPLTPYQYMGIGTNTSNYMVIGFDWSQGASPGGVESYWSSGHREPIGATTKSGGWNSVSRSGSTAYYDAALMNGEPISTGLTKSSVYTDVFTPSSTPYDINLFRTNGLNNFTIGGTALLNYASTYLSPTDIDNFAQRANTLQVAFNREIFI